MDLKIECSPNLGAWLQQEKISLAFTTYQTNRLILLGSYEDGRITLQERLFDKPMGLYADATSLYMSTRYQIWTLENRLAPGEAFQDGDCLYVPSSAYTTGNVNVHDVALDRKGKLIFVNTDFSCLAELKTGYSFQPIWQPPFISELRAEDRCHLNGLALVEGEPTYLSACSETNEGAGWRNCRQDGGIVLHLPSNEIIMRGLSMPHSPRFYRDKLWVLNSGSGELGYIEAEKFYPITFCSAFVRGLAFWKNYAFVGLSKLRSAVFSGLVLEERLLAKGHKALCGLMVVDLNTGEIVHSLIFNETIEELFDVVVLPGVIRPKLLGLQNEDIERLVCFPGSQGLMVTRPTVKRPSLGPKAPIAGLPEATISSSEPTTILTQAEEEAWNRPPQPLNTAINFQRVYHLNPESLAPYDGIMFPSLQVRWKNQSPKGEIVGVSAALEGDLLGFVIGERLPDGTAEIISLFVEPSYRHQGIATRLVSVLEKDCWDTGVVALHVLYTPSRWTSAALEPLLKRRGWKIDAWGNQILATKGHPDLLEQVSPEKADPSLKVQVKTLFDKAKQRVAAQDYSAAIACYQAALQILPNYAPSYCNLGSLWQLEGDLSAAIEAFQRALEIKPDLITAYDNLGVLYTQIQDYPYSKISLSERIILLTILTAGYLEFGFYAQSQQYFSLLETLLLKPDLDLEEKATQKLYQYLLFSLPYLRDDPAANSCLSQLISQAYHQRCLDSFLIPIPLQNSTDLVGEMRNDGLRIGIISQHFRRHSVGWCCRSILQGWAQLTPYLFLYQTGFAVADDLTHAFQHIGAKFTDLSQQTPQEIIEKLRADRIDVLIDLDSLMNFKHALLLAQRPAPVVVSWLGCEPPYISEKNYYLCDRRSHPEELQKYYQEQLLYLPETGIAIKDFPVLAIERETLRQTLQIEPDTVVYLSVSPAKKLTPDLVKSQVAILKQVPNSILLHKGYGHRDTIYQAECEKAGVDPQRCRWLERQKLEEEHRLIYYVADVGLDTYPYNGGSHNLEFLWFNVPLVTRCGKQAVSRFGYAFLQNLGIDEGIAYSWEEYIEWGVRYGTDFALRQQIRERLQQSKQTDHQATLWQPQRFAQESYQLFQKLLNKSLASLAQTEQANLTLDKANNHIKPSLKLQLKTLFEDAKQRIANQDYSGAIACYQAALQILPNYPPTYCNLGSLWQLEGNLPEAIEAFQKAIQLQPNLLVAYQNLGGLYSNEHRYQEAIQLLHQGLTYLPCASLHLALGDLYRQLGDIAAAMECYREAIRLDENYIAAYQNLGALLMSVNNIAGAKFCFKKVLDLNPEIPGIYRNLGEIYEAEGNPIKALECFNYALTLEPDNLDVLYRREHLQVALCDWDDYDQRMLTLLARLENYLQTQENAALPPLSLNSFPASLPLHRDFNRHWAKNIQARMAESKRRLGFIFPRETPSKLRIGYLSADFRNHAVGFLIRELFAYHNRDQFEVYAYSLSNTTDEITEQISSGCDHYQMIASLSVEAAAEQIHSDGIHILIDLCGYTNLCRPEILALQPAPLQLHYLGYPDTLGADFIPYILGDRFLIPPHLAKYYTETLVELPHAFVTTSLSFSEPPPPRSELGLPDGEFVYACFNRTDKWSPELFACCIQILQAVPNAVLWLAESSEVVSQTLQAKAKTAGVNPARLVFLVKRSPREFISVCRQANLFLDTFLYNGGATSVCAIQAGVPLLTCPGDTFASRMGMSICHAAGLESFVCESLESYQVQAIYWGTHSEELRQFTQQWQQKQGDLPLFQTATWIKAMETQLMNLWQNQIRNCI
ncbi:MAG: TIGR03032 family protein [Microcystis panniformis WG22]|nr:TIGR03032 family protein [Microcystis panniformis WG22]